LFFTEGQQRRAAQRQQQDDRQCESPTAMHHSQSIRQQKYEWIIVRVGHVGIIVSRFFRFATLPNLLRSSWSSQWEPLIAIVRAAARPRELRVYDESTIHVGHREPDR
jgi:hypothetical protein